MQHRHAIQHQGQGDEEQGYGQQLMDIHTNALPGITRPEEGEQYVSHPGRNIPVRRTYEELERARAHERYYEYLDTQDYKKLPNAFDLGWRQNLGLLFGPRRLLWPFPISSTAGNGWTWEPNPKWVQAQEAIRVEREAQAQRERDAGWGAPQPEYDGFHDAPIRRSEGAGRHYVTQEYPRKQDRVMSKADKILGRDPGQFADAPESRSMHSMRVRDGHDINDHDYDDTSDDDESDMS